jgi:archaemetzincin
MSAKTEKVGLLPVGDFSPLVSKVIATHIAAYLKLAVEILPRRELPRETLDTQRLQYDAAVLLKRFEKSAPAFCSKIVAVVDVDLFVPLFTHVLGEAEQNGRIAIVSLYRLRENFAGRNWATDGVSLERAAKVTLHELGHLFNLWHCADTQCLMRFSSDIAEVDLTPMQFCRYCSVFLRDSLTPPGHF